MTRERRILVPIDGSTCALRALVHAADRLKGLKNASLVLLNVQLPVPRSMFVTPTMIADHQRRHSEPVMRIANAAAKRHRVSAESCVRIGEPASTIARVARQLGCSEIVMGTRGLGRWTGFVLGSTAMKLLHISRLPITVIR